MPQFHVEPCRSEDCPDPSSGTTFTVEALQDGVALAPYPICGGCGLPLETSRIADEDA